MPRRSLAPLALVVITASALACNFPVLPFGPAREATAAAVMRTIDAMAAMAATPVPAGAPSPTASLPPPATPTPDWSTPGPIFEYKTQPGDTLFSVAARFGVDPEQISAGQPLPEMGYLPADVTLHTPNVLPEVTAGVRLLPDSEAVYSPSAVFDVEAYVRTAGGFLSQYEEEIVPGTRLTGAAIVEKVAQELSVNPRLLLGLIEYRSGWVFGVPPGGQAEPYPIGFRIAGRRGLYQELMIAATQLNRGYYGWREGDLLEVQFDDGTALRFHPGLNAGSVAVMHLMALLRPHAFWLDTVYGESSFPVEYARLFGDPWARDFAVGPPVHPGLTQPPLDLPFGFGERWSLTGGPHPAWNAGTPRGALDFSPISGGEPCAVSPWWATAAADGVVARSRANSVALDLDGDGLEQTGWVVVYLHLAQDGLVPSGAHVRAGDHLGHPSCQGGRATGKHVHIARKFNGEWIAADGPVPFVLSGWQAVADERNYYGALVLGEQRVTSNSSGERGSTIMR